VAEPATKPADDAPKERQKKNVTRAGAWGIALVASLVAAALAVGVTYALMQRGPNAGPSNNSDLAKSSVIDGLTSGKNVPTVPEDAYDGESPKWNVVAEQVQPTVVAIQTASGPFGGGALGSGVIINSEKGYVVTNNHVVADSRTIEVVLADGRIYEASVLGTDSTTDLAVLEITDPPDDLKEASLGDSNGLVVGEPVMAVGNPLGYDNTVTTGIVSALNRPVTTQSSTGSGADRVVTNAIQVDAAINPGNSGGPLFNSKGQVVGINSSIATLSSTGSDTAGSIGLAFAIPVNVVANVAGQLVEHGKADHSFLGVTADNATVKIDGVTRAGAELITVERSTPAEKAGLKKGDVIVALNGNAITGAPSLTAWVRSYLPGDEVVLTIMRDDKALDVRVTLAAAS
jgi:putative serine protease PepD